MYAISPSVVAFYLNNPKSNGVKKLDKMRLHFSETSQTQFVHNIDSINHWVNTLFLELVCIVNAQSLSILSRYADNGQKYLNKRGDYPWTVNMKLFCLDDIGCGTFMASYFFNLETTHCFIPTNRI